MDPSKRPLLATMTKEPFQPVRLYYLIQDRAAILKKFHGLKCVEYGLVEGCWLWLYKAEASSLELLVSPRGIPKEKRPIILGRIRFPDDMCMTLEVGSVLRAVEGAKFFAPRLGSGAVPIRFRIVNRLFAGDEGEMRDLLKMLDRDVTVHDMRKAEASHAKLNEGIPYGLDAVTYSAEFNRRAFESKEDVPLVEDFPLWPEEESPDFRDLRNCLLFRWVRAWEHWQGNTHLTLRAVILQTMKKAYAAPASEGEASG